MTTNIVCRWALSLGLLCGIAFGAAAESIDTRCLENGGLALCTEPVVVASTPTAPVDSDMWTYNLCDMDGSFPWREAAWCTARGGCGRPVFDESLGGVAIQFERIVTGACQLNVTDSGWGQTIPSNILCWTGPPLTQNGKVIRDFRKLAFSGMKPSSTGCNVPWTDTVYAGKWRAVGCPAGYATRSKPNGDLECWKFVPECSAMVGNPINLLDGCKLQREVDYRPRTPGGIDVERFYNSAGYLRFDAAPPKSTDYWRTTWDRRIVIPTAAGGILAYAQRADGSLQVFMTNGRERLNTRGGGSALLERLADSAGATSGWRLTTAELDLERYDASGRLLSIALRAGWTYTLAYDGNGRLASVTDASANIVTFTYDAAGRPAGFVAPGNRVYLYKYDDRGRLTSVTYPDGTVRTYHYENASFLHALTGITDENGVRFATWSYDTTGRAISSRHAGGAQAVSLYPGSYYPSINEGSTIVVDAFGTNRTYYYQSAGGMLRVKHVSQPCPGCNGGVANYTFDANGNVSSYTDFNRNNTTYAFDLTRNLEIVRTEAVGTAVARTITTQWHPVYRLPTKITTPSGVVGVSEVTDLDYDSQGNLIRKSITAGSSVRQWTTTFNAFGQALVVDGPRTDVADTTSYSYYGTADACIGCRGSVRSIANALGHVTTFNDYDLDGQLLRVTDSNGMVTMSAYDARGRLRRRTVNAGSPEAETTTYDYDNVGQLTKVTMPDGAFLRYQYDDAHRLTEIADGEDNVIQYTLDAMGNRIKEDVYDPSDRLVKTRQRTFDVLNRLYNDIGATGQTSAYQYDGNGNLTKSSDPLSRATVLSYDALNHLLTATDPTGGVTRYGYDARDHLVSVRDPNNLTTTYAYDGLGNLTQLASPDTGTSTFAPDAQGNVVGSTDARGLATSFAYDALNRQTRAAYVGANVAMEYDNTTTGGAFARGRLTRITDPSGSTTYAYDARGRVVGKSQTIGTDAGTRTFSIGYQYAAGRATGITYPSGRSVSYTIDPQGRISAIRIGGQTILSGAQYLPFGAVQAWTWSNGQLYRRGFDADGRIAALTLGPNMAAYGDERWTFGYDGLNRLTSAVLPQGESFAYVYDANGNRKQEVRAGAATNYGYAIGSNRLQQSSGASVRNFTYDAAGNLTSNGTATFSYDGRGRMNQASTGHKYWVNGLGQRVAKTGSGVATGANYFLYDEQGHLIGEYDAAGATRQELIYLADTPVASVRPSAGGGVDVFSIYSDHLDTPRLITNQLNQIVWEWKIDTFGAGSANENPSGQGAFSFNLRFPGQYYDGETGLHYNYFRDYDPGVGRYVESDPIGIWGGLNTYTYVANNPLRYLDPTGENIHGNWCGPGGSGPMQDSVDQCCKDHDACYDNCSADWRSKVFGTGGSKVQEEIGNCDRKVCGCLAKVLPKNDAERRGKERVSWFFKCATSPSAIPK
ncbi:MAG: RHS repeat-associated core domain-containing protein [Betaproteobacteria bacterium]